MKALLFTKVTTVAAFAILVAVGGCGRTHFFVESDGGAPGAIPNGQKLSPPRGLAMFSAHTERRLSWDDVRDAMQWADVIIVGEQHNDAIAHKVELALVSDAISLPGAAGVSMEMFERDEQETVDAYLSGKISQEQLVSRTGSANWGAKGKWGDWYQPIVDAAKDAQAPLIAANAPRRYVKQARVEGYGVLWAYPRPERDHYFIPRRILTGSYADRFMGIMTHHSAPRKTRKPKATSRPATTQPAGRPMPRRKIDPNEFFRAQLLWDATMAGSIAEALDGDLSRVIHIVGQFHTDFDGGTVQYLLDQKPDLKILTVSLQKACARSLRPEDKDRADVVIYTMTKPEKDKKPSD